MAEKKAKAKTRSKSGARRPQAATKRRARPRTKSQTRALRTRAKARPKHAFTVSHHRDEDFDAGLRRYAHYRDLGMAKADAGHGAGACDPVRAALRPEEVSKRHYHDVDFQMV